MGRWTERYPVHDIRYLARLAVSLRTTYLHTDTPPHRSAYCHGSRIPGSGVPNIGTDFHKVPRDCSGPVHLGCTPQLSSIGCPSRVLDPHPPGSSSRSLTCLLSASSQRPSVHVGHILYQLPRVIVSAISGTNAQRRFTPRTRSIRGNEERQRET